MLTDVACREVAGLWECGARFLGGISGLEVSSVMDQLPEIEASDPNRSPLDRSPKGIWLGHEVAWKKKCKKIWLYEN